MSPLHINLPPGLTAAHTGVLRQYFQDERVLSTNDWARVLEGMDLLRAATFTHPGGTETFAALYNRQVDAVYADGFIEQLLAMDDPATQSEPLLLHHSPISPANPWLAQSGLASGSFLAYT
jgi:hypothetical protein